VKIKNGRKISIIILIAVIAIIAIWDIFILVEDTPGDTFTAIISYYAGKHPIIPFLAGVCIGHLFWPHAKSEKVKK
jgi:hypothetical protein